MRNNHSQQQRGQASKHQQQGQGSGTRGGHQMQQSRRSPQQQNWNPENRQQGHQGQREPGGASQGYGWGEEALRSFGQGAQRDGAQFEQPWGRGESWGDAEEGNFEGDDPGRYGHQQANHSQQDFGQQRGYGQQGYGMGGYGQSQPNYGQRGSGRGGYSQGSSYGTQSGGFAGGGGDYYGQGNQGQYGQGGNGGSQGHTGMGMNYRGEQQWQQGGQQQQQPRFGKGPKGYKRSDERIKEDVSDRISQMGNVDASDVEIEVKGGEVTLTGSVPSRTMKWQLENLVESVGGVTDVNNQLRIKREEMSGSKATDEDKSARRSASTGSPTGMPGSPQGQHK